MNLIETPFGIEVHHQNCFVFFGYKDKKLSDLKSIYPNFKFQTMHQVHGDDYVIISEPLPIEPMVDATITDQKNLALVIKTADCQPICIFDSKNQKIAAIHAGWRGVEQRIFPTVVNEFFSDRNSLSVFVGPHILWPSFEIEDDIAKRLLNSGGPFAEEKSILRRAGLNKELVNLFGITQAQAMELEIPFDNFFTYLEDTKTNQRFNSYRRDQKNSGRNLSFIVLK